MSWPTYSAVTSDALEIIATATRSANTDRTVTEVTISAK
jgi:hypothetical protein